VQNDAIEENQLTPRSCVKSVGHWKSSKRLSLHPQILDLCTLMSQAMTAVIEKQILQRDVRYNGTIAVLCPTLPLKGYSQQRIHNDAASDVLHKGRFAESARTTTKYNEKREFYGMRRNEGERPSERASDGEKGKTFY
jgi:hypothetical protein